MAKNKLVISLKKNILPMLTNSGSLLILASLAALILANSPLQKSVLNFIHIQWIPGDHYYNIIWFINDGLMTFFFLIIAIELKEEFVHGALSSIKKATIPFFAAMGGMLVPALIFYFLNINTPAEKAWAIPMATDIAFALAIYKLIGQRLPEYLKIVLTALAVFDDFGSILVIAFFYRAEMQLTYLIYLSIILIVALLLNKTKFNNTCIYFILLLASWYCLLQLGIHATMAGVIVGLCMPLKLGEKWFSKLNKPVYYFIVPAFAFVNILIPINFTILNNLNFSILWGIIAGLILGKPIGIILGIYMPHYFKIARLPKGIHFKNILSIGLVASIGFTVSLFVAELSLNNNSILLNNAKIAILISGVFTIIIVKAIQFFQNVSHKKLLE